MALVLHGFRYSVYVRVARIALAEKALAYQHVEIDPFAPGGSYCRDANWVVFQQQATAAACAFSLARGIAGRRAQSGFLTRETAPG